MKREKVKILLTKMSILYILCIYNISWRIKWFYSDQGRVLGAY